VIVFSLEAAPATPVLDFQSRSAVAAELAAGNGPAHIHLVRIDAGGEIGPHVAGFGQLFVALDGTGWVCGEDGERVSVSPGQVAYFARGERHAKGSDRGLRAMIIQVRDLHLHHPTVV
jgi:quercetin dioxygenase-like cupin family protein